jgi:tetratricopeptide (TPR) repeat protein
VDCGILNQKWDNKDVDSVKYMICCLNPRCKEKNPQPDAKKPCYSCGHLLVPLLDRYHPVKQIGAGQHVVTYKAQDQQGFGEDCVNNLAIKLKPDNAVAYINLGNARYDLGDTKGAIYNYTQAAKLFQKQGKIKDSQDALERVKKLSQ